MMYGFFKYKMQYMLFIVSVFFENMYGSLNPNARYKILNTIQRNNIPLYSRLNQDMLQNSHFNPTKIEPTIALSAPNKSCNNFFSNHFSQTNPCSINTYQITTQAENNVKIQALESQINNHITINKELLQNSKKLQAQVNQLTHALTARNKKYTALKKTLKRRNLQIKNFKIVSRFLSDNNDQIKAELQKQKALYVSEKDRLNKMIKYLVMYSSCLLAWTFLTHYYYYFS